MTEAALTQRCLTWLRAQHPTIWWLKVHGGPYQRAGIPDLLLCKAGRAAAVEFKQPGAAATRLQAYELGKLGEAGAPSLVCSSFDSFTAFIDGL